MQTLREGPKIIFPSLSQRHFEHQLILIMLDKFKLDEFKTFLNFHILFLVPQI